MLRIFSGSGIMEFGLDEIYEGITGGLKILTDYLEVEESDNLGGFFLLVRCLAVLGANKSLMPL